MPTHDDYEEGESSFEYEVTRYQDAEPEPEADEVFEYFASAHDAGLF